MYKEMLRYSKKYNADLVECGFYHVSKGKIEYAQTFEPKLQSGPLENCLSLVKHDNTTNSIWNKLYKRTLIGDTRFSDYKYSEDLHFNSLLAYKCEIKCTISKEFYYYNLVEESAIRSPFSDNQIDQIKVRKSIYNFFSKKEKYEEVATYISVDLLISIVRLHYKMTENEDILFSSYVNYFKKEFNSFFKKVPKFYITNIKPQRLRVAVRLYAVNPTIFHHFLIIYRKFVENK